MASSDIAMNRNTTASTIKTKSKKERNYIRKLNVPITHPTRLLLN